MNSEEESAEVKQVFDGQNVSENRGAVLAAPHVAIGTRQDDDATIEPLPPTPGAAHTGEDGSSKWWMIVLQFVCGIEGMESKSKPAAGAEDAGAAAGGSAGKQQAGSKEEKVRFEEMRECLASVTESDGMRRVATANAIALLTIGVFIWAFLM